MSRKIVGLLAASLWAISTVVALAPSAVAQTSAQSSEAEALALMDKAAAAYAALNGLSMKTTVFDSKNGKTTHDAGTIAFEKSGRSRITSSVYKQLSVQEEDLSGHDKTAKQLLGIAMREVLSFASVPLFSLVQGQNPLRNDKFFDANWVWKNIRMLPNGGIAAEVGESEEASDDDFYFSFYLDSKDHLLRRVDFKTQIRGKTLTTNLTTFSDIQINPQFAPDAFVQPTSIKR